MAISIEIRNDFVYLVEARASKTSVGLLRTHHYAFPEDWVSDAGILNPEGFSSLLLQHLKEAGMREKKVHICINNPAVIYRELNIPKVEDRKIPLLVRTEMMSALNLSPDYIMDYVYLNDVESDGNAYFRVLGVAMQNKAIDTVLDVAKRCHLQVQSIDSATNSILKFLENSKYVESVAQLIVADVGNGHLRLYLFENGIYALSRSNKIVNYKETSDDEFTNSVVENINKMIQFSYTRKTSNDSKKVVLVGIDDKLEAVQRMVSENLLVDCEILTQPYFVTGLKYENRYVNAIGTLLRK